MFTVCNTFISRPRVADFGIFLLSKARPAIVRKVPQRLCVSIRDQTTDSVELKDTANQRDFAKAIALFQL
jgi:hypothetical protein